MFPAPITATFIVTSPPSRGPGSTRPRIGERRRPDVGAQPRVERLRCLEELDDAVLDAGGSEPRSRGPLPPGDQALVLQELGARMVLREASGDRLQDVVGGDLES